MPSTNPRVVAYLAALTDADPQGFSRPPGLGNIWRNRLVSSGLKRGVIVVHHTGAGLAFRYPANHHCCVDCARTRGAHCTHCTCALCIWEREAQELDSPPVARERVLALAERLKGFQIAPRRRTVGLLDDD